MASLKHASPLLLGFWLVGFAPQSFAQGTTPEPVMKQVKLEDISAMLVELGYRGQIKNDNGNYVSSASSGTNFFITVVNCDDQGLCKTLAMETQGLSPNPAPSQEQIDKFMNDNNGWVAVAKSTNGKYYGFSSISLVGGVTKEWLRDSLSQFAFMVDRLGALMK